MAAKLAVYAIGLLALASAASANLIEEYASKFADLRNNIDKDTLSVAEGFARKLGDEHYYRFKMNTMMMSSSSYDKVNFDGFLEIRNSMSQLGKVRDADATLAYLIEPATEGQLKKFVGGYEGLVDKSMATKHVEEIIVSACERYVSSLKDVFEANELVEADRAGKLSSECRAVGGAQEVKEFVMGWAHYHICNLLARGDRATLIDRVAKRAQDKLRMAQRISEIMKQRKSAGADVDADQDADAQNE